jgi:hypothetical protein
VAAEILYGGQGGTGEDLDHDSILSTVNRILSPGARRAGGDWPASKNVMDVRPMVFHPLGPSEAETPV